MNRLLILLFLVAVTSAASFPPKKHLHKQRKVRSSPKSTEEITFRLPDDVIPTHYDVEIFLRNDTFDTNVYLGVSIISTIVQKATNSISFHARNLEIATILLRHGDDSLNITWTDVDPITDIVTVLSTTELVENEEYVLSIFYLGTLSKTEMNGFYESTYSQDGLVHYVGSTDFEPLNARKAFPSFDEPAFKATFNFTFTVPSNLNVIFNTKILSSQGAGANIKRVTFETTPLMSTYLIAFVVSEFTCTQGDSVDGTPTEVCSTPETEDLRDVAVEATPKILQIMQNYTGFSYANSTVGKLSQASIPDYDSGAMENWGLAIYRETYLLWDEEESSDRYKQDVVTIIAHELSHQWFGDLVTLDWWTDVFLNEGFATYFEYYASDELFPEWELPKQFVVEQLQVALQSDSYDWAWPLSYYVETPEDISDRFDDISYDKGGSILRMVRYFLGLENFKAGLSNYIAKNQFSIGTPVSLWDSFDDIQIRAQPTQLPATVSEIMQNWTYEFGYPLLTVTSDGDDVIISQNQFLIDGTSHTKWYVPITYTLSNESTWDTTTRAWLTPEEDLTLPGVLSDSDWIILNNEQIGYYRVDYDDDLWQKISDALSQPDFGGINTINRAQIADDLFNFALAYQRNYSSVLDFLVFLENETEYYPWYSAFNFFHYLLVRVGDANVLASLKELVSNRMELLYSSTPFDDEKPEDHVYTLKQDLALSWACSLNNEDCISNAIEIFADYRDNSIKPSRNLKSVIYCNALRHSDNASRDFDFLWSKYLETQVPSEQETILDALGCITDEDVLKQYLQKAITVDGGIRKQDFYTVFGSSYSSSTTGLNIVFDFIIANYEQIISYFDGRDELYWLIYAVTNRFNTQDQVKKLEDFIQDTTVDRDVRVYGAESLENVLDNMYDTEDLEDELTDYFALKK